MNPNNRMYSLISSFPQQIREALLLIKKVDIPPAPWNSRSADSTGQASGPINNIVICGMGGSGIGGTIISELAGKEAPVPISVCKSYLLPEFVNDKTLVIACSYSGNTEETLSAFRDAGKREARLVCISSGGEIKELARKYKSGFIEIPGGYPPRAAFGYPLVMLLYTLHHYKIISAAFTRQLRTAIDLLNQEQPAMIKSAKEISTKILDKKPVIYCDSTHEGVAVRFRQQLEENSKILASHHVVPEMNHNELVGWSQPYQDTSVIMFRTEDENERNRKRFTFCTEIFRRFSSAVIEIHAKGNNMIERTLYLVHFGDWISYHLAGLRGIDAMEVNVIDRLKEELKK
ncbi:MAG: bifunctional phosphoglucose/phosphomannose isomerase [Bacteroidetes bacterium]|nr:bifunctional phosphoglucose/phosphomannose isomerase [Bacteroidota bacterium]